MDDVKWSSPTDLTVSGADTQADLDAAVNEVLEQAAGEVRALSFGRVSDVERVCAAILALRPNALQALERVRREARVEGMRCVTRFLNEWGDAGPDDIAWSDLDKVISAIRAMIEAERGKP